MIPSTRTVQTVPVIDLAPYRTGDAAAQAAVAETVDRACRRDRLPRRAGHGVPLEVIAEIEDMVKRNSNDDDDMGEARPVIRRPRGR